MKITLFGLTLSSSWGNGHATPYRALLRALHQRRVTISFFEKDVPYYASHRDLPACNYSNLILYDSWDAIRTRALTEAAESDVVVVASYCPEGARISDDLLGLASPLRVFYDLDTPITLNSISSGEVEYLRREQIREFDLYLSFTGGSILERLQKEFGAQLARTLYGCVDPDVYHRVPSRSDFECSLSYMGTYAADRADKLRSFFVSPAVARPDLQFLLAGSLYPTEWQWPRNVARLEHAAPCDHPALYSSSRMTLNLTRAEMAEAGYCPSGRFFEAAACGTPILTDYWAGLETFFDIERELRIVGSSDDVLRALKQRDDEIGAMAERGRLRTLEEHSGSRRADELLRHLEAARHDRTELQEVA